MKNFITILILLGAAVGCEGRRVWQVMPKEHVVIFALLCIIAFGAGYWVASRGQRMNKFDKTSLLIFLSPIAIAVVVIVFIYNFFKSLITAP